MAAGEELKRGKGLREGEENYCVIRSEPGTSVV
jgi:hypothetical protein